MSAGPSVIKKRGTNRSNLELVNALRDNFTGAQEDYAPETNGNGNGNGAALAAALAANHDHDHNHNHNHHTPVEAWTERQADTLFIPRLSPQGAGLRDEASQYEITVKLFLLPETPVAEREQYAKEAFELIRRELGIQTIDLLVVSFPGMSFEGNCEWEADKINAQQGNLEEQVATWRVFEELHRQGLVQRLGVAEFGSEKLAAFIERTSVTPAVDQINLQNCCNVPPPLKKIAAEQGVELNVHTDCTDILPNGTLRELLGPRPLGAGILAGPDDSDNGLKGEVKPQWVVRYMAFVRDRGVIENKGYFAVAELEEA